MERPAGDHLRRLRLDSASMDLDLEGHATVQIELQHWAQPVVYTAGRLVIGAGAGLLRIDLVAAGRIARHFRAGQVFDSRSPGTILA